MNLKFVLISIVGVLVVGLLWLRNSETSEIDASKRVATGLVDASNADDIQRSKNVDFLGDHEFAKSHGLQETNPSIQLSSRDQGIIQNLRLRFAAGDYQTSLELIEKNIESVKSSAELKNWLRKQLQMVLIHTAWVHLKTGHCNMALVDFERAKTYGLHKDIATGQAYCLQRSHRSLEASRELEWYLEQNPRDQSAHLLYAETLESSRDYERAQKALELALVLTKTDEQRARVELKLKAMKEKLQESRNQEQSLSRYFSLLFPSDLSFEVRGEVLSKLDQAHEELIHRFGARELRGALEVILYPQESFRDLMSHGPHWLGGVFDGRIRIPVPSRLEDDPLVKSQLIETLRHELVHAVFFDMSSHRNLPPWFNEGFAQYFACLGNTCQPRAGQAFKAKFLSVDDFQTSFSSYQEAKAGLIYRQSLYMIQLLEAETNDTGMASIVESIGPQSPIDSDSLLLPLGFDFKTLHERAKHAWESDL